MIVMIDDPADTRVADYVSLNDPAMRREFEGDVFFIAEGPTAVGRLIASDHRIRSLFVSAQRLERTRPLIESLADDTDVFVADRAVQNRTVGFDLHRGLVASAERRPLSTIQTLIATCDRIAVVEALNDPENLGAIARSARALDIGGLILDPTCIDPYYRRTVRVSMGEILFLSVARATDWPGDLNQLIRAGFEIWALTPDQAADNIWMLSPPDRLAVMFGAEGPGLTNHAFGAATRRVRLPIAPDVDSLNVAAAAAVTFGIIGRGRH